MQSKTEHSSVLSSSDQTKGEAPYTSGPQAKAALTYQPFRFRLTYTDPAGALQVRDTITSDPAYRERCLKIIGKKPAIIAQFEADGCVLISMDAIEEIQTDVLGVAAFSAVPVQVVAKIASRQKATMAVLGLIAVLSGVNLGLNWNAQRMLIAEVGTSTPHK